MAKIDVINNFQFLNVTATVGRHGVNLKDDVVAVQALLKYALGKRGKFRAMKFPVISGGMNRATLSMIEQFQEYVKKSPGHPVKVSTDGRIDPAKGDFLNAKKRRWSIIELNFLALEMWLLDGAASGGFIADVCARHPQVKEILDNTVGTLGLSLEPSSRPLVGSLRLALE